MTVRLSRHGSAHVRGSSTGHGSEEMRGSSTGLVHPAAFCASSGVSRLCSTVLVKLVLLVDGQERDLDTNLTQWWIRACTLGVAAQGLDKFERAASRRNVIPLIPNIVLLEAHSASSPWTYESLVHGPTGPKPLGLRHLSPWTSGTLAHGPTGP